MHFVLFACLIHVYDLIWPLEYNKRYGWTIWSTIVMNDYNANGHATIFDNHVWRLDHVYLVNFVGNFDHGCKGMLEK